MNLEHPCYGSVENGSLYFATKLHSTAWTEATTAQKTAALLEAARRIDRLRFKGVAILATEEFPRYTGDAALGTEVVPDDIIIAAYEIAYSLLDGIEPETEFENLGMVAQGYSSVRSTYDRTRPLDHYAAGIPSFLAWTHLMPYLASGQTVTISRAS